MGENPALLFLGLPPDFWTAIASIATVFLACVALIPIFKEWRDRCAKAAFLRKRINYELVILDKKAKDVSPNDDFTIHSFEEIHRVSFDSLKELLNMSDPLRPMEQDHLREFVVDFRTSVPMKISGDFDIFRQKIAGLLKAFPTRTRK